MPRGNFRRSSFTPGYPGVGSVRGLVFGILFSGALGVGRVRGFFQVDPGGFGGAVEAHANPLVPAFDDLYALGRVGLSRGTGAIGVRRGWRCVLQHGGECGVVKSTSAGHRASCAFPACFLAMGSLDQEIRNGRIGGGRISRSALPFFRLPPNLGADFYPNINPDPGLGRFVAPQLRLR